MKPAPELAKELHRGGNLDRDAESSHGRMGELGVEELTEVLHWSGHWGIDDSGGHRIDADAVINPVARQVLRECHQAGLGRTVAWDDGYGPKGGHRRHVDHARPAVHRAGP